MGQAFGVIGLEVMGRNIALNIERNGFPIAVYNRTYAKTEHFINELAKGKNDNKIRAAALRALSGRGRSAHMNLIETECFTQAPWWRRRSPAGSGR